MNNASVNGAAVYSITLKAVIPAGGNPYHFKAMKVFLAERA